MAAVSEMTAERLEVTPDHVAAIRRLAVDPDNTFGRDVVVRLCDHIDAQDEEIERLRRERKVAERDWRLLLSSLDGVVSAHERESKLLFGVRTAVKEHLLSLLDSTDTDHPRRDDEGSGQG